MNAKSVCLDRQSTAPLQISLISEFSFYRDSSTKLGLRMMAIMCCNNSELFGSLPCNLLSLSSQTLLWHSRIVVNNLHELNFAIKVQSLEIVTFF